jgi:hypothetical protein
MKQDQITSLPQITVTDKFDVPDVRAVLLAEFGPDVGVREIVAAEADPAANEAEAAPATALEEYDAVLEAAAGLEEFPETVPVAQMSGVRLVRVLDSKVDGAGNVLHDLVTAFDAGTGMTPLTFLLGGGAVLASTRPGETYAWQLVKVGQIPDESATAVQIEGCRLATAEETVTLNEMYPGWLEACKKVDEAAKGDDFTETLLKAPRIGMMH